MNQITTGVAMPKVTVIAEPGTEVLVYEAGSATDPIKVLTDQVAALTAQNAALAAQVAALQGKVDAAKVKIAALGTADAAEDAARADLLASLD